MRLNSRRERCLKIQILGTGCPRCKTLALNAEKAVKELGLNAEIEKVTAIQDILKFEILMTPGLVINGVLKVAGRVPSTDEIKQLIAANEE